NTAHAPFIQYDPMDIKVEIKQGELLSGRLDQSTIGSVKGSIFHIIHNQYGATAALDACFDMQQIANTYMYNKGFSITLEDTQISLDALHEIHRIEASLIEDSLRISKDLNEDRVVPPIGK